MCLYNTCCFIENPNLHNFLEILKSLYEQGFIYLNNQYKRKLKKVTSMFIVQIATF